MHSAVSESLIVVDTNTPLTTFHRVESVTAGGAADIALGTTVGSATTGD
jgi:lipid-binding SYLF domain-containing protein